MAKKLNILEINNVDIYGKRFNGFSITKYINEHPELNLNAKFIVNHKFGSAKYVVNLFKNSALETYDWKIEEIEKQLGIKNQISISENALIEHPLYQKADILHFHMYHNSHFPIEFLARISSEKKIIVDVHDTFWLTDDKIPMLEVFNYADGKNKKSLDKERKRILNSINAKIIIHSPYMARLAKQSSVTKNLDTEIINFGIDSNTFKPLNNSLKLRNKYHIPQTDIVLMCRAQKEFKGTSYIKSALKKLNINTPITIITVSVNGLLDNLKNKYNVIDFGNVNTEKQMVELYNLCDIFLAPSTEESFGFMAAEAMSCAKPIIVFEGTALPDTVNSPAIGIATKRDSTALALAIKKLIENPKEREKRGKAGREFVLKNYNEQQYFDKYIKLFTSLSKIKARSIEPQPKDSPPKNISDFPSFLNSHLNNSEFFDYNNSEIQTELQKYNSLLYKKIKKQGYKKTSCDFIKHLIPHPIKLYIKKIQKGFHG